uniref:Exonuclease 5 n=1 Tax=Oncorhynchus kisutch TaxID=8019 RepID=A0A8C7MAB5_ONCKI
MNSKTTPRDDPLDDGCDISNAQLIRILSERLAPSDQPSLTPPAGTSLTPAGTSTSLSAGADQHSPTLGVCVVNDGQSLAKKEERIDGQIKKRGHKVVAPFERLSNNRSTVTLSVPDQSPMERFSKHHLNVTQLCEQSWCEIKVVYGFLKPHMKRREMRRPAVMTGASIHLARELEANPDAVTVVVHTREDREALKLINLIQMVPALEAGQLVREFPVLGVLDGVFFLGVVDELYCSKSGDLVLSELKTRSHNSLPHPAQAKGHSLQPSPSFPPHC